MDDYAILYGVSKSVICEYIHFVLKALLENKNFTLFGKKSVTNDASEDRLIDVTEIRIERPKNNQRNKYSGKKKYHTMKIQIIKGSATGFIYEIQIGLGAEHDFHLFKRTFEGSPKNITYTVDLGYVGIDKLHANSRIPKKNSKKHKLTEEDNDKIGNFVIGSLDKKTYYIKTLNYFYEKIFYSCSIVPRSTVCQRTG